MNPIHFMPTDTPTALVEAFKKSGEFERLRRDLLAKFQQDESYAGFKEGVEGIARKRLANDQALYYQGADLALKELTQEIQRYPIVERAVANIRTLSDPALLESMQKTMKKILLDEKGGNSPSASKETGTVRTEVTQSTGNQPEKAAQDVRMESGDTTEHEPNVADSTSLPLDPQKSTEIPTATKNPTSDSPTLTSEKTNAPTKSPPESNAMESEPSSNAISAENSNVNLSIDDQRQMTTDVEMEDA